MHALLNREAAIAFGRTAPNPPVAAVALQPGDSGIVLCSGGTEPAGQRHAEIVALDTLDTFNAACPGASTPGRLYVTLEPCSHFGRTPPCTARILGYACLRRIIVYAEDPSLPASGTRILRAGGRIVHLPGAGARRPPRPGAAFLQGFQMRTAGQGPRLHYKLALSAEGVMGLRGCRLPISGTRALEVGQMLRAKLDAVVVGPGTLQSDRPALALRPPTRDAGRESEIPRPLAAGRDPFWDSLFEYESDIWSAVRTDGASAGAYQPARVLIFGRPFAGLPDFLQSQERLARQTGRPAVKLVLRDALPEFQARSIPGTTADGPFVWDHVLPALGDPAFARELRHWLADRGWNEVLIEGGAGLLSALQPGALPEDRIYLLRSRRRLPELLAGTAVAASPPGSSALAEDQAQRIFAPDWLLAGPEIARYNLGEDELHVSRAL